MSDFCSGNITHINDVTKCINDLSPHAASYDVYSDTLSNSIGVFQGRDRQFISNPMKHWKFRRVSASLTEIMAFKPKFNLLIDMQDGRNYGIDEESKLDYPVFTYCRRYNSKNIILWPLPNYHTIGSPAFFGGLDKSSDGLSFLEKKDLAVWRGALSGHCSDVFNDKLSHACHQVMEKILDAKVDSRQYNTNWLLLQKNVRFSFCKRTFPLEDVDAKIVLNSKFQRIAQNAESAQIFSEKVSPDWIVSHKYIVCLRGYDTASNFLMAVASNSVALKEEDGWQVFYSCLFKPWVHYIPLQPGGIDVVEKINWARKNQDKCLKMIKESHKICRILQDERLRDIMCSEIIRKVENKIQLIQEA